MSDTEACCAHLRVEYRTEDVEVTEEQAAYFAARSDPASPHVPPRAGSKLTHGWWECASGCGTRFVPQRQSESSPTPDPVAWMVRDRKGRKVCVPGAECPELSFDDVATPLYEYSPNCANRTAPPVITAVGVGESSAPLSSALPATTPSDEAPRCTICGKVAVRQDIDGAWWPPCEHAKANGLHTLRYPSEGSAPDTPTWREAASAPQTGEHVLVTKLGRAGFGYCGVRNAQQDWCAVVHYWPVEDEEGFYLSSGASASVDDYPVHFTHWMPLP